ncbi:MAG: hypothetical protein MUP61_01910 [Burkholderiales bacterium]|nr:hypothetical protein [Burkholderiales bacterium]
MNSSFRGGSLPARSGKYRRETYDLKLNIDVEVSEVGQDQGEKAYGLPQGP